MRHQQYEQDLGYKDDVEAISSQISNAILEDGFFKYDVRQGFHIKVVKVELSTIKDDFHDQMNRDGLSIEECVNFVAVEAAKTIINERVQHV